MSDAQIIAKFRSTVERAASLGYSIREYSQYSIYGHFCNSFLVCKEKHIANAENLLEETYNTQNKCPVYLFDNLDEITLFLGGVLCERET